MSVIVSVSVFIALSLYLSIFLSLSVYISFSAFLYFFLSLSLYSCFFLSSCFVVFLFSLFPYLSVKMSCFFFFVHHSLTLSLSHSLTLSLSHSLTLSLSHYNCLFVVVFSFFPALLSMSFKSLIIHNQIPFHILTLNVSFNVFEQTLAWV